MKAAILLLAVFCFLFFSSCDDEPSNKTSRQIYKYTGYDSSWNKIITGYLWIESIDSVQVKGRWDFDLVGNGENVGPQIGKGKIEGTMNMLGTMSLNLNPDMIDNNIILNGSLQLPYRFDGSWSYIGFPGEINWGRFEATQIH
jgi:hypothetical protein